MKLENIHLTPEKPAYEALGVLDMLVGRFFFILKGDLVSPGRAITVLDKRLYQGPGNILLR